MWTSKWWENHACTEFVPIDSSLNVVLKFRGNLQTEVGLSDPFTIYINIYLLKKLTIFLADIFYDLYYKVMVTR